MREINGERRSVSIRNETVGQKMDEANAKNAAPSLETYIAIAKPSASQTEAAVKLLAQTQLKTIAIVVGR